MATFRGTDAPDTLIGGEGVNLFYGEAGDDSLVGGGGSDFMHGDVGSDTLLGGDGNGWLLGEGGPDSLVGGGGTDHLDGGFGRDTLIGGAGDDEYTVNLRSDVVIELDGGGVDELFSYVTVLELLSNIENLRLAADVNGTGNAQDNRIVGFGNNVMRGLGGDDVLEATFRSSLYGGAGDDLLIADWRYTTHFVNGGPGDDTLQAVSVADLRGASGIEVVDLGNSVRSELIVDVPSISTNDLASLRVMGDVGDAVYAGGDWIRQGSVLLDGIEYRQYTAAGATLLLEQAVGPLNPAARIFLEGHFFSGAAVDVDGDGLPNLLLGASAADTSAGNNSGVLYVVGAVSPGINDLGAIGPADGYTISGPSADSHFGGSMAMAGDVNGDGIADVIAGSGAWVLFSGASGVSPGFELSMMNGSNGFQISRRGGELGAAGDMNGDGFADVVQAPQGAGRCAVVFGAGSGLPATLDVSGLDGQNGFAILDPEHADGGFDVASAGDINGDGFADLLIGAQHRPYYYDRTGHAYVVLGTGAGFPAKLSLSSLDGSNGFRISGGDGFAESVSSAGDFNGDGLDDIVISSLSTPGYHEYHREGSFYVIFGKPYGFHDVSVNALGTDGFVVPVATEYEGEVEGIGDFNGDGFADIAIAGNQDLHIVLGRASGFGEVDVHVIERRAIDHLRAAGDVNGDGFDDLIATSGGLVYVIYGHAVDGRVGIDGTHADDSVYGSASGDILIGGLGNDLVRGGLGNDVEKGGAGGDDLGGGKGADRIEGDSGNDILDGARGADRLFGDDGNDVLDGGNGPDTLTGGIGCDRFVFNDDLSATTYTDRIMDFGGAGAFVMDRIQLENSVFTMLTPGDLAAENFVSAIDPVALDADDYILYDLATGRLFYDADGNGPGQALRFARLMNAPAALDASDFVVT